MDVHVSTLRIFRDLAEARSFSKAASRNAVTQSAVSQQVAALEKRFQCRLVDRAAKPLGLTPQGEIFYQGCCRMLKAYDEMIRDLQEGRGGTGGSVSMAVSFGAGLHDLPPLLKKFQCLHGGVKLHVEYRRASEVASEVASGNVELGVAAYPPRSARLSLLEVGRTPLAWVASCEHPLAGHRISLKQLAAEKILGLEMADGAGDLLASAFSKARLKPPPFMDFDHLDSLKRAAELGMGVALLPDGAAADELRQGSLKRLEVKGLRLERPLAILRRKGSLPAPAAALARFLEAEMAAGGTP